MNEDLYPQSLPELTKLLWDKIQESRPSWLSSFYLSGGTALALHLGHRESEDLDFFSQGSFDGEELLNELSTLGSLENTEVKAGTLNTYLKGVKLQFLGYPYPLLESVVMVGVVPVSSVLDVACSKLVTVSQRGSKKDFIDLYFVLERYSLKELLESVHKKYSQIDYSQTHLLKSLIYFEEAEGQPMPRMHQDVSFEQVKEKITQVVKAFPLDT